MDLTNTRSPRSLPSILIRSARNEPPEIGDVGSRARIATLSPLSTQCLANLPISVDFPEPGGPVTPSVQIESGRGTVVLSDCANSDRSLDRLRRSPDFANSKSSEMLLNSSATPNRLRHRLEHSLFFFVGLPPRIPGPPKLGFLVQKRPSLQTRREVPDLDRE